jgi:hypothetical protein
MMAMMFSQDARARTSRLLWGPARKNTAVFHERTQCLRLPAAGSWQASSTISDPDFGFGVDPGRLRGYPLAHLAGTWW